MIMKFINALIAGFYRLTGGVIPLPVRIRITAQPVVMLTGPGEYAVLWATNRRGCGDLAVTTGGETKRYRDAVSGIVRSNDTLHAVRVPKEALDNCDSYRVENRYVFFSFSYLSLQGGRTASGEIAFRGYRGQAVIHALMLADVHGRRRTALANAAALREDAGTAPDFILLAGDISHDYLLRQGMFNREVLRLAAKLSGGAIPCLYCRGNHETRGQWAAEMRRYFPTGTGELYFTASYGPISFTVLDTGEDKADDHVEYSGLADFAPYRARQLAWLNCLAMDAGAEYRVVVCHMDNLDNGMFPNWYAPLRQRLGITHLLCGHTHKNRSYERGGVWHYEEGGKDAASWITFRGGGLYAKSVTPGGGIKDFGGLGDNL